MKLLWLSIILLLTGCSALESDKDKSNVNSLIKSHEIRKISSVDLVIGAKTVGNKIIQSCDSILLCGIPTPNKLDSIGNIWNSSIVLHTTLSEIQDSVALQLFDAYKYSLLNGYPLESTEELLDDNNVLYAHPFILDKDSSCSLIEGQLGMWHVVIPKKTIILQMEN